jgi:hypothetical protein
VFPTIITDFGYETGIRASSGIGLDTSFYIKKYISGVSQGYDDVRRNTDNLTKLKNLSMIVDNLRDITLNDGVYYNTETHLKLTYIDSKYIQKFKEVLYITMEEQNLDILDLQAPNLTEIDVESHLDALIALLPAFETNILAVTDEEYSVSLLFYADMFKKYLLYLKDIFTPTLIDSYNKITYVSEGLYNQYKVINFVQQTFSIIKPIYNALLNDRFFNATARMLTFDLSSLAAEGVQLTSTASTPTQPSVYSSGGGGEGSVRNLQDVNSILTR